MLGVLLPPGLNSGKSLRGAIISTFEHRHMHAFVPSGTRRYECPVLLPRFFGARQCERIIEAGQSLPRDDGLVATGQHGSHDTGTRLAGISWMTPTEQTRWIFDKLASAVMKANRIYQFDLLGFTEDAQFTRYDSQGAFYDWHQDGLEDDMAVRKLSVVVQLSDPATYQGADLEVFSLSCDREVADAWRDDLRVRGTVIVFPAFEFHRVTRLVSGLRYSLVCWVGGPPFR